MWMNLSRPSLLDHLFETRHPCPVGFKLETFVFMLKVSKWVASDHDQTWRCSLLEHNSLCLPTPTPLCRICGLSWSWLDFYLCSLWRLEMVICSQNVQQKSVDNLYRNVARSDSEDKGSQRSGKLSCDNLKMRQRSPRHVEAWCMEVPVLKTLRVPSFKRWTFIGASLKFSTPSVANYKTCWLF